MANNEKIIDVGMQANDGDLNSAMQRFQQDLARVKTVVDTIGSSITTSFKKLDDDTKNTIRNLQRMQSMTAAATKLSNINQLSPAQQAQLQRQIANEQIRGIRDVATAQNALDQTRLQRAELIKRLNQETKKETLDGLTREIQLNNQIELKLMQRIAAFNRLDASRKMSASEELRREQTLATQQIQNISKVSDLRATAEAARLRQAALASRLETQSHPAIVKGLQDQIALQKTIQSEVQKRITQLDRLAKAEALRANGGLTTAQGLSQAKLAASFEIRAMQTKQELENRLQAARERGAAAVLRMNQSIMASDRLRYENLAKLAQHEADRAQSRLNAMGRQNGTFTGREQLNRDRLIAQNQVSQMTNVESLRRMLADAELRRSARQSRLERSTDDERSRLLMRRIEQEKMVEKVIRDRIKALEQEAKASQRAGAGGGGGGMPDVGLIFSRTALYGGAAAVIYGVVNALKEGIRFAVELEDKLANLQAIAGIGEGRMQGLSQSILEVARSSKYATLELVGATTSLAQAGFTAGEMEGALAAVSNLAMASGTDLATAADTATSAIGAFQLQASEATRISDGMVAALNRSKLTIQQIQQAIQYVGATALESDIKLEELVAMAGSMANAGVSRGSTIGTGTRQLLVDLQSPSEKLVKTLQGLGLSVDDVNVKTRGIIPVLETLRDSGFGTAAAYGSLETRAAAAYLVLKNNIPTMYELIEAQGTLGVAAEAAAVATDSLASQWQIFKNNLGESTARNTADDLQFFSNVLKGINRWMQERNKTQQEFDEGALTRINNLRAEQKAAEASGDTQRANAITYEINAERSHMYNSSLAEGVSAMAYYTDAVKEQTDTLNSNMQSVGAVDEAIVRLLTQSERYADGSQALRVETLALTSQFDGLSQYIDGARTDFRNLIDAMMAYRAEAARTASATAVLAGAKAVGLQGAGLQTFSEAGGIMGLNFRGNAPLEEAYNRAAANPENQMYLTQYRDLVGRIANPQVRAEHNEAVTGLAQYQVGLSAEASARRTEREMNFQSSPGGQQIIAQGLEGQAALNNRDTPIRGTRPGDRIRSAETLAGLYGDMSKNDKYNEFQRGQYAQLENEWNSLAQQYRAQDTPEEDAAGARSASAEARRTQSAAAAAERRQQRTKLDIANEGLNAAKLELEEVLELMKDPLDVEDFSQTTAALYSSFNTWSAARREVMKAEIEKADMSPQQIANLTKEVDREIAVKQRELSGAITDSITSMYDHLIEQAQRNYDRAIQPFEARVEVAQARVTSYDRTYNQGNVPDYVRSEQDYQVQRSGEDRDRQSLSAMRAQIAEQEQANYALRQAADFANRGATAAGAGDGALSDLLAGLDLADPDQIIVLSEAINELGENVVAFSERDLKLLEEKGVIGAEVLQELRDQADALSTSLQTVPVPDFATGLQMAAQNYARLNNLNRSFEDDITMGLGGAFSETHGIMNSFFNDLITKPMSAATAFQSMGEAIIAMMARMAAEAAAKQIMSILLSFIPGAITAGSTSSLMPDVKNLFAANPGLFYDGGEIGNAGGGMVNQGISSRDSVLTGLARGEFVVRKTAVDSVGAGFLRSINSRGAEALKGMGGNSTFVSQAPARQDMSVYIVAPEEKPQLGANDVIAIIDRNIMKDGSTKRLIRHVSQGG